MCRMTTHFSSIYSYSDMCGVGFISIIVFCVTIGEISVSTKMAFQSTTQRKCAVGLGTTYTL